jgi:hypothetical protein
MRANLRNWDAPVGFHLPSVVVPVGISSKKCPSIFEIGNALNVELTTIGILMPVKIFWPLA